MNVKNSSNGGMAEGSYHEHILTMGAYFIIMSNVVYIYLVPKKKQYCLTIS